jgi:hypothetical protein
VNSEIVGASFTFNHSRGETFFGMPDDPVADGTAGFAKLFNLT